MPLLTGFWLGLANGIMAGWGGGCGGGASSLLPPSLVPCDRQQLRPPAVPKLYDVLPPCPREVPLSALPGPWVPQHPSTLWVVPSLQSLHVSHLRRYSRCSQISQPWQKGRYPPFPICTNTPGNMAPIPILGLEHNMQGLSLQCHVL